MNITRFVFDHVVELLSDPMSCVVADISDPLSFVVAEIIFFLPLLFCCLFLYLVPSLLWYGWSLIQLISSAVNKHISVLM